MKRLMILMVAFSLVAMFACKKEETTNVDTTSTSTMATDTSATTSMTDTTQTMATASIGPLSDEEKKFVMDAANDNMAEVAMGQMGATKATNQEVKDFANRMATDHGKTVDEIRQLATSAGITLPTEPDAAHKKTADDLSKKSGAAFDKAFMAEMVKGHVKDVAEFEKESKATTDHSEVKDWAAKTLPTLQDHLKMAQDIQKKLK